MTPGLKVCATPGCPELTPTGHCFTHTPLKPKGSPSTPYRTRSYQRARRHQLRDHPTCQCDGDCCPPTGCGQPATEVDHRNGDPTDHRPANLASLTKRCHSRRTARDQAFGHKPDDAA